MLFLAVLAFNNWLLGLIFDRRLLLHGAAVSELSVPSVPHAWLFRVLDIVSGVLFIVVALILAKRPPKKGKSHVFLITGTLVLGIANIVDGLFPLHCSDTANAACTIPVRISLTHFALPDHAYSSIIIGASYLALPLAGLIYSWLHKLRAFMIVSGVATIAALVSFATAIEHYIIKNSFSVHTLGFSQEAQMLLFGIWFIFWYLGIYTLTKMAAETTSKPLL